MDRPGGGQERRACGHGRLPVRGARLRRRPLQDLPAPLACLAGREADGQDGFQRKEFLSKNLYFRANQIISDLDEIVSASKKEDSNDSVSSENKTLIFGILNDKYLEVKKELFAIVEETEAKNNIDSFIKFDTQFQKTIKSVEKSGALIVESEF